MSQDMSPDVQKRLKLMAYWLFGIFLILSAAGVSFVGVIRGITSGGALAGAINGWPIVVIAGVLCLAVFFGYRYWITKPK